ncbi:MAG: endolytic transglycosylase MltG [Deltaproteobacteria bacterium]|nr:endolytic transglycosylase MltG [Deltaproteobacteria bacterium]
MPTRRGVLLSLGLLFLLGVFFLLGMGLFLVTPAQRGAGVQSVTVREGETPREVAQELENRGIVTSSRLLHLWIKLLGHDKGIKVGEYALSPEMSPMTILERLRRGLIVTHPVTIPEGFNRGQIADLLAERGVVERERFLALTRDWARLKPYGISAPSLEGYLFPDTYRFGRGVTPHTVVDAMVKRFFQVIAPLEDAAEKAGMKMEDVITLASIVEKETGRSEERPIIASVFLNRLKKGMRLDSDPTVIFGLDAFDGNLRKQDLSRQNPYNTYVIQGLPPGPIANPGLESIKAVLFPAQTDYIYFVSRNDGSHHFSKTLSEHNRAVNTYQKKKGQAARKPS